MGVKDMEGMTVSRADFWAVAKENLERGDQEEKERVSKAKVTYMEARKREKRDPRKRKIGKINKTDGRFFQPTEQPGRVPTCLSSHLSLPAGGHSLHFSSPPSFLSPTESRPQGVEHNSNGVIRIRCDFPG